MLDGVYVDVEAADHSGKYDHLWKSLNMAETSALKNGISKSMYWWEPGNVLDSWSVEVGYLEYFHFFTLLTFNP